MGNVNFAGNDAKQGAFGGEEDTSTPVRHDHQQPQKQRQQQQGTQDADPPSAAPSTPPLDHPPSEPPPPGENENDYEYLSPGDPPLLPVVVAATPGAPRHNRPRVDPKALAFHAVVASGDIPSVEAYIAQHAEKIRQFSAAGGVFGEGQEAASLRPPASGIAALLMVPGPKSDAGGGGGVCPLEVVDLRGRTPLHTACLEGRVEVVRLLLRAGADANAFDDAGFSPLHRCAQSSDLHSASALLDGNSTGDRNADVFGRSISTAPAAAAGANPDVDVLTRKGDYRPIHLACYAGSAEMVSLLARRGADLSAGDKWGSSPLHRACLEGNLGAARAVLDAGAEVDPRDNWKSTPLHRACHSGHAEIVELLLRRGAATSSKDDIMERPGQSFGSEVSSERRQAVAVLLKESEKSSRASVGGGGGSRGGLGRTPAPAAGGEERSPNRYIPPAARAAAAAAAAAETAAAAAATTAATPADGACGGGGLGQGTVRTKADGGVQPWRRKTSTWSRASNDGGPDLDGRGVYGATPVHSAGGSDAIRPSASSPFGSAPGKPSCDFGLGNKPPLEPGGSAGSESDEEVDADDEVDEYDDDGMFDLEVVAVCDGSGSGEGRGEIRPAAATDACSASGDDWRLLSFDGAPRPAFP